MVPTSVACLDFLPDPFRAVSTALMIPVAVYATPSAHNPPVYLALAHPASSSGVTPSRIQRSLTFHAASHGFPRLSLTVVTPGARRSPVPSLIQYTCSSSRRTV